MTSIINILLEAFQLIKQHATQLSKRLALPLLGICVLSLLGFAPVHKLWPHLMQFFVWVLFAMSVVITYRTLLLDQSSQSANTSRFKRHIQFFLTVLLMLTIFIVPATALSMHTAYFGLTYILIGSWFYARLSLTFVLTALDQPIESGKASWRATKGQQLLIYTFAVILFIPFMLFSTYTQKTMVYTAKLDLQSTILCIALIVICFLLKILHTACMSAAYKQIKR